MNVTSLQQVDLWRQRHERQAIVHARQSSSLLGENSNDSCTLALAIVLDHFNAESQSRAMAFADFAVRLLQECHRIELRHNASKVASSNTIKQKHTRC